MRQMQIELNEPSSRKIGISIHSLQSFSWKKSASRISDWVDNVIPEDSVFALQNADEVKKENQQEQHEQTLTKTKDLTSVKTEGNKYSSFLKDEVKKPMANQATIESIKPKKTLLFNPSAKITPNTQPSIQPTDNQLIKFPKLTLPEFSGNTLKWPGGLICSLQLWTTLVSTIT